jgi:hypothetical protein
MPNEPRLLLAERLNMPRGKRVKAFVDGEIEAGRIAGHPAQLHAQIMRYCEQEDATLVFGVWDHNYDSALACVDKLMNGDPDPNSFQGKILSRLVDEIQRYETQLISSRTTEQAATPTAAKEED